MRVLIHSVDFFLEFWIMARAFAGKGRGKTALGRYEEHPSPIHTGKRNNDPKGGASLSGA
jgi:hypothetical protein